MPTLTVHLPGAVPVSHVLKDETSTVGRMKGNTIVIEDVSISLMHARITRRNGEFYLKDLNSTNGTLVNGQPISEVKLRDGDRIRFAEITTQFHAEDAVVSSSAAPASTAGPPISIPAATMIASTPASRPVSTPAPAVAAAPAAPPLRSLTAAPAPAARPPAPVPVQRRSGGKKQKKVTAPLALAACVVLGVGGYIGYTEFFAQADKVAARTGPAVSVRASAAPNEAHEITAKPVVAPVASAEPTAEDLPKLVTALKNPDVAERRKAAAALHGLGPESKEASAELKEALRDSDPEVQMWAALTLSKNQVYDKAEVPILVRGLQHENPVLRQVVCLSMGLLPFEPAEKDLVVPALAETVRKDADEDVRAAAQSALSVIAPELVQNSKAVPPGLPSRDSSN